jgi:hypothetical protein
MKYYDLQSIPEWIYCDTDAIYFKTKQKKGKDIMKEAKFKIGDVVRILDGSKIKDFRCGYMSDMKNRIGEVHKISKVVRPFDSSEFPGYRFDDGTEYTWDERCLEKVDELYVVSVSGRNVFVLGKGKLGKARCNPEDKFDLAKGISLALDRMNDVVIKEGDLVEVVNPGFAYTTLCQWVTENIEDKTKIAKYKYGESVSKYMEGYVLKIAKHPIFDDYIAYVEGNNGCYVIGIKGLKKVKTHD